MVLSLILILSFWMLAFTEHVEVKCNHSHKVYHFSGVRNASCYQCEHWICRQCGFEGDDCENVCGKSYNEEYDKVKKQFEEVKK